jgi:fibronectin type 3 domain-containing protein
VPKGLPVPAAISDLRGEVRDDVLLLSFSVPGKNMDGTQIRDLAGFKILRNCGGCAAGFEPWRDIRLTDRQGYTIRNGRLFTYDNDLRQGFNYGYRVFPETSKGMLGDGSNIFSLVWHEPPAPPGEVNITEEDSRLLLSWEPASGISYNVYRWEDDIYPVSPINASPLSASQLIDGNLQNGKRYQYAVRALRIEGGVAYEGAGKTVSGTPRDKTPPQPPTTLKLDRKDTGVILTWTPGGEPDLAGYNVYRVASGKAAKKNADLVLEPRFFDEKPGSDPYVSYYVTAVDNAGNESGPSQEMTIILKE